MDFSGLLTGRVWQKIKGVKSVVYKIVKGSFFAAVLLNFFSSFLYDGTVAEPSNEFVLNLNLAGRGVTRSLKLFCFCTDDSSKALSFLWKFLLILVYILKETPYREQRLIFFRFKQDDYFSGVFCIVNQLSLESRFLPVFKNLRASVQ